MFKTIAHSGVTGIALSEYKYVKFIGYYEKNYMNRINWLHFFYRIEYKYNIN